MMDHHLRMMMLQQTEDMRRKEMGACELGDLAMFHRRLVEVVEVTKVGDYNRAKTVEFTDAGGVKSRYELDQNPWNFDYPFRVLTRPKDMVLDAILAANPPDNDPRFQLRLRTERWLADPQPGDLFHMDYEFWIVIDEVRSSGEIVVREANQFSIDTGWAWKTLVYKSADLLRMKLRVLDEPGYAVFGHSSRRAEQVPIIPVV